MSCFTPLGNTHDRRQSFITQVTSNTVMDIFVPSVFLTCLFLDSGRWEYTYTKTTQREHPNSAQKSPWVYSGIKPGTSCS